MIDMHAHIFFDALRGAAGHLGPDLRHTEAGTNEIVAGDYRWPVGTLASLDEAPEVRVATLDRVGIARQVLSLSPLWLFTHTSVDVTGAFHRKANELLAEWCSAAPDRLAGFASLPTADIGRAVDELRYAVTDLGLRGGYIGTDARARLDDPELDPLWSAAEELDVPLFVHSTVPGVDGPPADASLVEYDGQVTLGYPHQETVAAMNLIFGGVLLRHPRLDVVISHGGGNIAFQHGRLRRFAATAKSPITVAEFDEQFARLWVDTHVNSEQSLALLAEVANPDRLVFGSNYRGWDSGDVHEVGSLAGRLDANAHRLLRWEPARTTVAEVVR